MKCQYCHGKELKVTDSRDALEVNGIRRRRECLKCSRRFTTFETIELSLQVHKRDGRYEDFQRQKLINGLEAACRHTKISREQVIQIASEITGDLMQQQAREIETRDLGEMVMKRLQVLDSIAYIRFACVYRRFQNIEELIDAIRPIQPKDQIISEQPPLQNS
jgi:transcriptional repressor NrdR